MTSAAFDDRLIQVVLSYTSADGTVQNVLTINETLYIRATGMKYADVTQNECTIQIANLQKSTRDRLATQFTPFNQDQRRKQVVLSAGRVSTGLYTIFEGDITECVISQPPNIVATIKAKTMQFYKFNYLKQAQNVTAPLSKIAADIGQALGVKQTLFQATDMNVANWSYSGMAYGALKKLNDMKQLNVYVDDNSLIVKDADKALEGATIDINMNTGMVGTPELTELGVKVKAFLAPGMKIGGKFNLTSMLNPSLNGEYNSYQLAFDIASRDTPFYATWFGCKFPVQFGFANLPAP